MKEFNIKYILGNDPKGVSGWGKIFRFVQKELSAWTLFMCLKWLKGDVENICSIDSQPKQFQQLIIQLLTSTTFVSNSGADLEFAVGGGAHLRNGQFCARPKSTAAKMYVNTNKIWAVGGGARRRRPP